MTRRFPFAITRRPFVLAAVAALAGPLATTGRAQPASPPPVTAANVPVRQLTHIVSSDTNVLMGLSSVRHLPNGSVIVNDPTKRQLILFDSTLAKYKIIADTSTNSPNSYGLGYSPGGLIPYVADSSLFVDAQSQAFLVIDERGEFVRVMAPTRASDLNYMSSTSTGFDAQGRMIYKSQRSVPPRSFFTMPTPGSQEVTVLPDSGPLMRMDFDKRTVDTIGMIKVPLQKYVMIAIANGLTTYGVVNPLPYGDEWALLPDGTVAIVRGQDYHVDWLAPDGRMTSTPKLPFDWKRLTLEDKQHMIDSVKKAEADRVAKLPPPPPVPAGSFVFPNRPFVTVEPTELPDYYPAVRQGQVRADREGNVWILPSTSTAAKGGLLYDVVNRQGALVERVQLPAGRTLVGFGPRGTIYMHYVKSPKSAAIERATVLRPPSP